jgi:glycerate 2-kinase
MQRAQFQPNLNYARRTLASGLIDAVLGAVEPEVAFKKHFDSSQFKSPAHILALGKAAIPMTNAAIECLGSRFARATVITTPELCAQTEFKNKFVELLEGDHPYPTQRNIDASNIFVEHALSIPEDHHALVLISGGGSAMLCSPREGITLQDIVKTTSSLLNAGAPIQEINQKRSSLDKLKAGGLADVLGHVSGINAYVLSDVIGDDLSTIASGPLIDQIPPSIRHTIIASNQTALDALCAWIAFEHIDPISIKRDAVGFAADEGKELALKLMQSEAQSPIAACIGGEPTVDTGTKCGTGGPMLELALSCAVELAQTSFRWMIISLTTDGVDGPTNAAGAIITNEMLDDDETIQRVHRSLEEHNSLEICDAIGATIRTGATGTNVNDIAVAIRWDA